MENRENRENQVSVKHAVREAINYVIDTLSGEPTEILE
jgi:hypothetical protein